MPSTEEWHKNKN